MLHTLLAAGTIRRTEQDSVHTLKITDDRFTYISPVVHCDALLFSSDSYKIDQSALTVSSPFTAKSRNKSILHRVLIWSVIWSDYRSFCNHSTFCDTCVCPDQSLDTHMCKLLRHTVKYHQLNDSVSYTMIILLVNTKSYTHSLKCIERS